MTASTLTIREDEILARAARGLTNAQIGIELGLTIHAVKFHLAAIYRKLEVANRTEAASTYIRASMANLEGGR